MSEVLLKEEEMGKNIIVLALQVSPKNARVDLV